jgi:hypothetical protein
MKITIKTRADAAPATMRGLLFNHDTNEVLPSIGGAAVAAPVLL